jgi:aryl-alcohol dehydrogenase-like predicted oxidoreductase
LDKGINFFDTADVYALGESEKLLAGALGESRKQVIIATKVGVNWKRENHDCRARTWYDLRPERIIQALDASLARLRVDCIPLYYLHWPDPNVPLEDSLGAVLRAREAGKIRYVGLSRFSVEQIRKASSILPIAAVEFEYNLLNRSIEVDVLPCCRELGIGLTVFGPLAQGMLTGKYGPADRFDRDDRRSRLPHFNFPELNRSLRIVERIRETSTRLGGVSLSQIAINWLLRSSGVTSVITGVRSPAQVDENCSALDWQLPDDERMRLASEIN